MTRALAFAKASREFENEDCPIDDVMTALDLLGLRHGYREATRVIDGRFKEGPYIEVCYESDFSISRIYYFRITERVVDHLFANYWVKGKPAWGYTDQRLLSISDAGKQFSGRNAKELEWTTSSERSIGFGR